MDKILVLDFGGQYNQLIARRVREQHIYAEIVPYSRIDIEQILDMGYKGIIFTGGPNSVYEKDSPSFDRRILDIGIPILGICYGAQLMAYLREAVSVKPNPAANTGRSCSTIRKVFSLKMFRIQVSAGCPILTTSANCLKNSSIPHTAIPVRVSPTKIRKEGSTVSSFIRK